MADDFAFYAGLANMERGWCVMDCRRKCDKAAACAQIKRVCGYDIAAVRKLAAKVLIEMADAAGLERSLWMAV